MKIKDITIILDRSGSMSGIRKSVITHFNDFIEEFSNENSNNMLSLVQFDHEIENMFTRVPIKEVRKLNSSDFEPRGTTSLRDAIGMTIQTIKLGQKDLSKDIKNHTDVVVAVITDGLENSSKEYSVETLKKTMDKVQNKKGWKFLFFGANQDSVFEGSKLGVRSSLCYDMDYSSEGVKMSLRKLKNSI
jgi:uncharacterized protein YegL